MNKKNVILIGAVMCAVIGAGIFYWNYIQNHENLSDKQNQEQNQESEAIGSPDDYIVTEQEQEQGQEQGRFVENKRAGLKVRIPDNWTEEKMDIMEGSMVFYSPDMESMRKNSTSPPLKKGCMIEVAVGYEQKNFNGLEKEIKEIHEGLEFQLDEIQMIKIQNEIPALKNEFNGPFFGWGQSIYIIGDKKFYNIGILAGPEDIERCSQEFDEFLQGVVITDQ